jgi:hypothetical protein
MQNTTPTKRSHKKLFIILAVCATAITLVGVLLNNVSGSTKPIRAVADQFHAPASWKLVEEHVEPPRFVCFDVRCPSVHRSWATPSIPNSQELEQILANSGFNFRTDKPCAKEPHESGSVYICGAEGDIQKYTVSFNVWVYTDAKEQNRVIMIIE